MADQSSDKRSVTRNRQVTGGDRYPGSTTTRGRVRKGSVQRSCARRAWATTRCGREVESLLAQEGSAEGFLSEAALEMAGKELGISLGSRDWI